MYLFPVISFQIYLFQNGNYAYHSKVTILENYKNFLNKQTNIYFINIL